MEQMRLCRGDALAHQFPIFYTSFFFNSRGSERKKASASQVRGRTQPLRSVAMGVWAGRVMPKAPVPQFYLASRPGQLVRILNKIPRAQVSRQSPGLPMQIYRNGQDLNPYLMAQQLLPSLPHHVQHLFAGEMMCPGRGTFRIDHYTVLMWESQPQIMDSPRGPWLFGPSGQPDCDTAGPQKPSWLVSFLKWFMGGGI